LGATSIAAALHDVVDNTTTVKDIERILIQVAQLVEGLTKISLVQKDMNVSMQAENRKMLLTLNDDVRYPY
jgi:GTP pyrophosphokinase